MQDWKKVFSSQELAVASMVMGILNENEIPARSMNKKDSSYVFLGEIEIPIISSLKSLFSTKLSDNK